MSMSEKAGTWGSGQVDGPRTEWRIRMVPQAEAIEAEREVIRRMGQLPREWHAVALSGQAELTEAADRLLAVDLADVQWNTDLGVYEYRLTMAGRRVAAYLSPVGSDRQFRAHPASNYDGGLIDTEG
jgi:hypothetical protein